MYKFCINAGHGINKAGKRCLKSLDPKQTREWTLNSRIVEKIIKGLEERYTGFEYLRLDDPTGKRDIPLKERTDKANKFGANDYYSIHHNAGILGGKGGGIVVYTYTKVDKSTADLQKALYDKLIEKTGLKGNRSKPLGKANFHECRESNMPAVLGELGFMDSKTDTPIILTEEYATKCAEAYIEVIAERGKLTKKEVKPTTNTKLYRVQVGAYSDKANAEKTVAELKADGYDAIIV